MNSPSVVESPAMNSKRIEVCPFRRVRGTYGWRIHGVGLTSSRSTVKRSVADAASAGMVGGEFDSPESSSWKRHPEAAIVEAPSKKEIGRENRWSMISTS
jgi:hypothetical protein